MRIRSRTEGTARTASSPARSWTPALAAIALTYRADPAAAPTEPGLARLRRGDFKHFVLSAGGFAPGWALLGVFLAFGPAFTSQATGDRDDAVTGAIVCLVFVVSA